jgi:hypothetical protein
MLQSSRVSVFQHWTELVSAGLRWFVLVTAEIRPALIQKQRCSAAFMRQLYTVIHMCIGERDDKDYFTFSRCYSTIAPTRG